jgi:hypothetical protein
MSIRCALVSRSQYVAIVSVLLTMACSAEIALAQSENDFKTMEKARSMYLTGPVPSSISCGVILDWDGFFQRMKIEQTEATKVRLEKLKDMKITVVSRDAEHTDVKIDSDNASKGLTDGLRQQLQGFFQIYWSQSYGRLLVVKPEDHFELTTGPEGYLLKIHTGSTKVVLEMNKTYLITRTSLETPQMSAVSTPGFVAGEDGLLRLRSLDETIDMGSSKMVVNVNFDYQRVGAYDVPLHMSMALPGSFSFDYTLGGCEVKGDSAASTPKN